MGRILGETPVSSNLLDVEKPYFATHLLTPENPRFAPVIGLSILDYATTMDGAITPDTRILAGVRRPETNITDQNVISLPTQRVPANFLQSLLGYYQPTEITETYSSGKPRVHVHWTKQIPTSTDGESQATFLAKTLISSKLGVADALEDGTLEVLSVEPQVSVLGSVIGTPEDPETGVGLVHMVGLRVMVGFNENPFPERTASYKSIQFIRAEDFSRMVEEKDLNLIGLFGDWAEVCVLGLCVASGNLIIGAPWQ